MKAKIILIVLICFSTLQANAQTEFAPLGAEWYYTNTSGCCPEDHFNCIVSKKDTIIEGNNCRILRQYYDNSNIANEKYIIKQEQGKVYYYYQNQFNLLFDFNAEINDIVEFTFIFKKYDDFSLPSYKDTVLSAKFEIENITTNAQNLKTFEAKVLDEDAHKFLGVYYAPYTYIYTEKIGAHNEFMPMLDNAAHPDVDIYRWLRCYSDADFSFISEEWETISLPCDYCAVLGINALKDDNITIYPNPFNDNVFVFSTGGNIEIIDVSGKLVYCSELLNGINKISTNHFLKGIHLVKIKNKDNGIQTLKIVKL
ncbi:MAG: T9SS type A sorting domain-containing protein [Bacteroidales bacterium]|jgi:hypothetical protein|nr:T9SS type A sorting domain-containing protein [Bacteroidales bacterium]